MGDTKEKPRRERARAIVRVLLAVAMAGVGVDHLVDPIPFVNIVPRELPMPLVLVYVSGVCEIALGLGLLMIPFLLIANLFFLIATITPPLRQSGTRAALARARIAPCIGA